MIRALLGGEKTCTRRVVKYKGYGGKRHPVPTNAEYIGIRCSKHVWETADSMYHIMYHITEPYSCGDILYVRETWCDPSGTGYPIMYKADMPMHWDAEDTEIGIPIDLCAKDYKWRPSIHMPREAARIFLRVTDVRVERLQDMTEEDALDEGYDGPPWCAHAVFENYPESAIPCYAAWNPGCPPDAPCDHTIPELFGAEIWDKTIKKSELEIYGWDANPWVWVIEFEQCEKPAEVVAG